MVECSGRRARKFPVHEESYRGRSPAAYLHRRRLRTLLALLSSLDLPRQGTWADFGCSNGFILALIQHKLLAHRDWRCIGFDHSELLLGMARERGLPATEFRLLDLNEVRDDWPGEFDVVTCFETLEHVGNYGNALENLVRSCRVGGRVVISVPNENGLPGLLKYLGRRLLRRNPYGDFFRGKSELRYVGALLAGDPIDGFRSPPAHGWGPHLGFDSRKFGRFLNEHYIESGRCRRVHADSSNTGFTHYYVLERSW